MPKLRMKSLKDTQSVLLRCSPAQHKEIFAAAKGLGMSINLYLNKLFTVAMAAKKKKTFAVVIKGNNYTAYISSK